MRAPATELARPGTHVPALDGVRGLAILMVMVLHLMIFNNNTGNRWIHALSRFRGLGGTGVDLFFVLSGFLITGILYDTLHSEHYFRNFYMRRFLRIFPLYYGFLFLLLALTPWLHVTWGGRQYVLLAYLQNTAIWFPIPGFNTINLVDLNHFWSLAVEEQFYLFWPFLVYLVKDRRKLIHTSVFLSLCAFILRVILYLQNAQTLPSGIVHCLTPCRMDTLMIGGILALYLRGSNPCIKYWHAGGVFYASVLAIAVMFIAHLQIVDMNNVPFMATFGYTIMAVGYAAIIFMAIQPYTLWNRFFSLAWLRSLGKYSYGIYVLHILVGSLVRSTLHKLLGTSLHIWLTPRLHSRPVAILVEFAVSVSVVYMAAWLSYNLYEVHFLQLKKYFKYAES